jgi:hypothetical protein
MTECGFQARATNQHRGEQQTMNKIEHDGNKTLQLRIYLFTDSIAETKGQIIPKHALDCGGVWMPGNEAHGIDGDNGAMFNSLNDLPGKIMEVLAQNHVVLHLGKRQRKEA